jgi:flagellar motor switch protein FliM
MQPQFASIATPSEVVVAAKFDIDLGDAGGALHICLPYSSVEPIRDVLFSNTQADTGEPDQRWVDMLSSQVQSAEVDVVAQFTTINATLKQVLNMRPGDVIAFEFPERVQANVHGVPVFYGRPGVVKGKYAIQVERLLAGATDDLGGNHAV